VFMAEFPETYECFTEFALSPVSLYMSTVACVLCGYVHVVRVHVCCAGTCVLCGYVCLV